MRKKIKKIVSFFHFSASNPGLKLGILGFPCSRQDLDATGLFAVQRSQTQQNTFLGSNHPVAFKSGGLQGKLSVDYIRAHIIHLIT